LPKEFPDKWRNKVICGNASTSGKMIGGSSSFLDFPFKLTISDEGIFAEYNLGEKFDRDEWGKTQTVRLFEEATRKTIYDEFNAIEGFIINYKVPNAYTNSLGEVSTKHSITEIFLETFLDKSRNSILGIKLVSGSFNATVISSNHVASEICESILSKEERIKLEAERKATENLKKEADRLRLIKINDVLSKSSIEEAIKEYGYLTSDNFEMKAILQQKWDEKHNSEVLQLDSNKIEKYIRLNKKKLSSINPGNYILDFDKAGNVSNTDFPNNQDVPLKWFGSFSTYLKSQMKIKLELKDSILISTKYNSGSTKPLFIDKNENFYFKTKTGLPAANFSIYPSIIDKKMVKINKVYKREKYANGILIDSQEFKTEKTVGILKKDQ
jgi:hypothetical protein